MNTQNNISEAEKQANDTIIMNGRKSKSLNELQVEKAKRMREDKHTFPVIVKTLGISISTVRRAINSKLAYKRQ